MSTVAEPTRRAYAQTTMPSEPTRPTVLPPSAEPSDTATYTGSCMCRAVTYQVVGELGDFGYCHCQTCRKASGTAFGANSPVDRADLNLLSGSDAIRAFESSPGKFRAFCGVCGSPLYAYVAESPDVLRLRLGSLDTPFTKQAQAHTFVADKAPWEAIDAEIPRFDTWADKAVLHQRGSRQGRGSGTP
jgi:hypothetical protein